MAMKGEKTCFLATGADSAVSAKPDPAAVCDGVQPLHGRGWVWRAGKRLDPKKAAERRRQKGRPRNRKRGEGNTSDVPRGI